jgi:hypothetical protein
MFYEQWDIFLLTVWSAITTEKYLPYKIIRKSDKFKFFIHSLTH